jgi:hypothetical protein
MKRIRSPTGKIYKKQLDQFFSLDADDDDDDGPPEHSVSWTKSTKDSYQARSLLPRHVFKSCSEY